MDRLRNLGKSMKYLTSILILILSLSASATDLRIGYGKTIRDYYEQYKTMTLVRIEESNDGYPWFISRAKWPSYHRYPGSYGEIPKHSVYSVGKRVIKYDLSGTYDLSLYVDFGIAKTSKQSIANSSDYLFQEQLGLEFYSMRFYWSHTSNAGLSPPNEGEDGLFFDFSLKF